jgi:hypothetical protein
LFYPTDQTVDVFTIGLTSTQCKLFNDRLMVYDGPLGISLRESNQGNSIKEDNSHMDKYYANLTKIGNCDP